MWENIDRSMFKAIQIIQENVPLIAYSFCQGTKELIKKPSTSQLLSYLKGVHYAS